MIGWEKRLRNDLFYVERDVPVKPYSVRFSAIYSLWHGLHGAGKMSGYARLLQLTESDDAIHAMHGMDVVMAFNQCWRIRILRFFRLLKTRFYVFLTRMSKSPQQKLSPSSQLRFGIIFSFFLSFVINLFLLLWLTNFSRHRIACNVLKCC